MLVLLRITIGWHFLYAGLWKFDNPSFSAEGYLAQSRGPFLETFRGMLPDFYGLRSLRRGPGTLDTDGGEKPGEWPAAAALAATTREFADHYQLDEQQRAEARQLLQKRTAQVNDYLDGLEPELAAYFMGVEEIADQRARSSLTNSFETRRLWEREEKLLAEANGWKAWLEAAATDHGKDLDSLLTPEQRAKAAPPEPLDNLKLMDLSIKVTNVLIGGCLIAGLFTRLAAFGGAVFLAFIVASAPDWPGAWPPPHPSAGRTILVSKEFVEMMAMFTLAALPTGRWGGLDFFVHHWIMRPFFGKKV